MTTLRHISLGTVAPPAKSVNGTPSVAGRGQDCEDNTEAEVTKSAWTVSSSQTEIQGDSVGTWISFAGILTLMAAFVAFAVGGFFVWAAPSDPDPDVVRCGDDVMRPGDTCLAFGGDPDDEGIDEGGDYGEMRADRERQARRYDDAHGSASAAFHIGAILLPVAVLLVVVGLVVSALQQGQRRGSPGAASSSR